MEPAASIIRVLGGNAAVARALGLTRSRVWKWTRPKGDNGGTGGVIPINHIRPLIEFGKGRGVTLTAEEFLPAQAAEEGH